MTTGDISRLLLQPEKHYSGVRMQQGRVMLDSDWNEHDAITSEDWRRTLMEIVCSKGSSNDGFSVNGPAVQAVALPDGATQSAYDFIIQAGSFYLGGMRFEVNGGGESFLTQSDWLQVDADSTNLPTFEAPLAAGQTRTDLVYVKGWEQDVSAVEDSELRERALGGPDTSVRRRRMRQIHVLPDVPDTCATAFSRLRSLLTESSDSASTGELEFDTASCELRSNALLTISPDPAGLTEDPCRPAVPGGYLGADNQTLRVQLTAQDRFIWSVDNAAPLYRVQILDILGDNPADTSGLRRRIKFLTLPRDQAAHPLAGQAVELIPWGALLPNGEKAADFQGMIFNVESSFDPAGASLSISEAAPENWQQWLAAHDQFWNPNDATEEQQYVYLRLWTGGSGNTSAPDHEFVPDTPVVLTGTGLQVTFNGRGIVGDYWIAAARPHTPQVVVPWELLTRARPAGPQTFYAPLALIRWQGSAAAGMTAQVQDCRERFQPLCQVQGCCTVTVGDGITSHGMLSSIEEALDYLPASGGKICLLPGLHRANVRITERRNITISGCGKQTLVIPGVQGQRQPIFEIVDSRCIAIEQMVMVQFGASAVVVQATADDSVRDIRIDHNYLIAYQHAVHVIGGNEIKVTNNFIRMLDKPGAGIAIVMKANEGLIERNDVSVVAAGKVPPPELPDDEPLPDPDDPCAELELIYRHPVYLWRYLEVYLLLPVIFFGPEPYQAQGGIQLAAACEHIDVMENKILGGRGNGILLGGSAIPVPEPEPIEIEAPDDEFFVRSYVDRIGGVATSELLPVSGVDLVFTHQEDGTVLTATSGDDGTFVAIALPGRYQMTVATPGFGIDALDSFALGAGNYYVVSLGERAIVEPDDSVGFLYEIHIDRNEVSQMGLSGIGIPGPELLPATMAAPFVAAPNRIAPVAVTLGYPVLTLGIHHNVITGCLTNVFDDALRRLVNRRGVGGISLGYCEDVTIDSNRIENNGLLRRNPTCAIFVGFGQGISVSQNHVAQNGQGIQENAPSDGMRGGVVLKAFAFDPNDIRTDRPLALLPNFAARVHSNVVLQPLGQALNVVAVGPVSVGSNLLVTERAGPSWLESLVGNVVVINTGGQDQFPEGSVLFSTNQCRLLAGNPCTFSHLLTSSDDIGYANNQSTAIADGVPSRGGFEFINAYLQGRTVRAPDNRFKEQADANSDFDNHVSLVSSGALMNNTTNNQGDHCILPFGSRLVDTGNLELDNSNCDDMRTRVATSLRIAGRTGRP